MGKEKLSLAYAFTIINVVIVGFSFLFTKIALQSSSPIDTLAFRFTASFIAIVIPILFKWIKLDFRGKKIIKILPLALFYPTLFFGFQAFGLVYATSSEGGILQATSPIFTVILATYFLQEKTNWLQKLSIAVSVFGVIYILLMQDAAFDFSNIKGIILLLLSAISIAAYSVLARSLSREFKPLELSYIMLAFGFIFFNMLSLLLHVVNGTLSTFLAPLGKLDFLIAILYLGILSSLVTSLLSNFALSKIEASKMSVFANLGTVISMIAGVIFLQEKLFYYHIIGSILIIGGVIGTNLLGDKKRSRNSIKQDK